MTEYTPTEPEIAEALATLTHRLATVPRAASVIDGEMADLITIAALHSALDVLDEPLFDGPTQVRKARAALEARTRWAEQETKAA